ncbi:MAG TPA: polysaccharide deacetylase family protein [Bacteroidia bacterium]|jgi:peptidoglycan/xylan/chitin deacetylase (PgdA/CDA1 family)|nr:polysaccharide deacetylase family protein [Bacteroidia bacterium]
MLTFKTTNVLFLGVLAIVMGIHAFYAPVHWLFFVLMGLIYSLTVFYGSAFIQSGFHISAVCKGLTSEKIISITFDDGPNSEITPQILDVLKEENLKAAFFCIGRSIPGKEDILKRISAAGHILGNHSYSHAPLFDFYSSNRLSADLSGANGLIESATGLKPVYFRPPYGVTTPNLARAVRQNGFTAVGWNIRSLDTTAKSPSEVMARIRKRLKPGSIVLFHDTMPGTVQLLQKTIQLCKEQGYRIVPLDELTKIKPYA